MNIGEKIKKIRKARGMTQAQLAGTDITRNMISLIESGKSTPSVDTLLYLSEQLKIDAGFFLSNENNPERYEKHDLMDQVSVLYEAAKWEAAAKLIEKEQLFDNETCWILCECYMNLGIKDYHQSCLSQAREALNRSLWYSKRTIYHTDAFEDQIRLYQYYLDYLLYPQSQKLPELSTAAQSNLFFNLLCLDSDRVDPATFVNEAYRLLWRAKCIRNSGKVTEAKTHFLACLEQPKIQQDPLLMLFIYEELEECSKLLNDYQSAYQFAQERFALQQKIHENSEGQQRK